MDIWVAGMVGIPSRSMAFRSNTTGSSGWSIIGWRSALLWSPAIPCVIHGSIEGGYMKQLPEPRPQTFFEKMEDVLDDMYSRLWRLALLIVIISLPIGVVLALWITSGTQSKPATL